MRLLCLCILVIASLAPAQETPAHFLIEFELMPGVDFAHLTQPRIAGCSKARCPTDETA